MQQPDNSRRDATLVDPRVKDFLRRPHRLLIDGQWVNADSGESFPVIDPATAGIIASAAAGGKRDIDLAVSAARRALEGGVWSRLAPSERARLLWRLADLIAVHAEEFAQIETLDNGMPIAFARDFFVPAACEHFRYAAGWCTKVSGDTVPVSLPGEWHAYTRREPVGVVAQIVAWNVPLMMAAMKIAPALAAGCTVVLKPAEETPLSALRLGELALEAGLPPGVLNIVTGDGGNAGAALAAHPGVDKVSFTGSTEVGRLIVKASAGNLKKVSLELGGKSPVFVFPDADLPAAIAGAANAIFFNSGQVCAAGSRLYIHERVYDEVVAGVAAIASQLRLGHGLDAGTEMGPLVSASQVERVKGYILAGILAGARVLNEERRTELGGYFVGPTVLGSTTPDMTVVREEIFGPVVCAMRFSDEEVDAIAVQANDTCYGLAAGIWTKDLNIAHRLASRIRGGTVWVNSHSVLDPALPWGGLKLSGWGREMGREGIDAYLETKSVAIHLG
ncbi:aldehyde dehydrogenase family protein [Paraburkholderia sp. MM5384-R2]|uniref:aldehyde dehydrogenase family protein n=1 Tax=Paraburkholderia sp. MM5384-R2 TaxID=2723097 RepID=UPI00162078F2|nr:aldehyde dehydrogenase family protein [Paraburkholderia sp. MM5384-R2]MBB5503404.1 phenylacetaldehyde dehydrogenase [Paraburkholderia sp. MM5384-R2]